MTVLYMTPTGAGAFNGLTPSDAFDWNAFRAWTIVGFVPGDSVYAESGNYTPASTPGSADGNPAALLSLIGITNLSDLTSFAQGDDRPLFDFTATPGEELTFDDYWRVGNLRSLVDSGFDAIQVGHAGLVWNCDGRNLGSGYGIGLRGNDAAVFSCSAQAPFGTACIRANIYSVVQDCDLSDSPIGIRCIEARARLLGNLIRDCAIGIHLENDKQIVIVGNTLYNGVTGILGSNNMWCRIVRNIISGFATPAHWTVSAEPSNYWDWNVWHNSATPVNVTKGPNAINADPQFSDPTLGTAAGFRVQTEVARQLGVNLFMAGGVPPSIYDGGETNISGTTDPDHSQDQLLLDGLETVTLDDAEVQNVYRLQETEDEREPTEGVYLERNVRFMFPVGTDIYPAGTEPSVGGVIVDGDLQSYKILAIRPPKHSDFWGATTRGLVISGTYSLDSTVTLFPAVETLSAAGSTITTHPAADASFNEVPAAIQLRASDPADWAGRRQITEIYDIYVDGDVGQLNNGDVLRDQDLKVYSIISFRNRDEIGENSVIECELRNP